MYSNKTLLEAAMDSEKFFQARKKLCKTQKQLAELLGTSLKAVHSYEQGWRSVPPHVERQLFFLLSMMRRHNKDQKSCWVIKKCPSELKKQCPAWDFQAGRLCWFINGTICEGVVQKNWREKMKICRTCEILSSLL
jgi:DNA-binding XRE family transcriptional regulator